MQTILTIEDDEPIRRGIVDFLTYAGYRVLEAANGKDGLKLATTCDYDLMLLDLVLPRGSGLEILRAVRAQRPTQPVIVLTARGEENDRVEGLRAGADDYVVKPFSVKELIARVEAVLRRSPQRPTDLPQIGLPCGTVDLLRREIRYDRSPDSPNGEGRAELSEREADLLHYLAAHRGRAVSREELLENVWRITPKGVTTRTIDMHIARLREKLHDDAEKPCVLFTVRGKGYMLTTDIQGVEQL